MPFLQSISSLFSGNSSKSNPDRYNNRRSVMDSTRDAFSLPTTNAGKVHYGNGYNDGVSHAISFCCVRWWLTLDASSHNWIARRLHLVLVDVTATLTTTITLQKTCLCIPFFFPPSALTSVQLREPKFLSSLNPHIPPTP